MKKSRVKKMSAEARARASVVREALEMALWPEEMRLGWRAAEESRQKDHERERP
jgi:hypothetical protein